MNRKYRLMTFSLISLGLTFGVSCSPSAKTGGEGAAKEEAGHQETAAGEAPDEHAEEGEEHGENEEKHEEGVVELTLESHARAGLDTAVVEARPLGAVLETTGQVGFNEDRLAHVGPRISGRIAEVRATLGQRVKRGQTLAVLDSTELGQAKANYQQARVRETLTRETYEREKKLAADKISSEQEALTARAAFLEAEAELRRAEQTLRLMGLSPGQIEGQAASSLSPVSSPFDGTVVEKEANLGEMVSPEQKLFSVADLSQVWIWIDVFEKDLRGVHRDDEVSLQVDAYPAETFAGKVSFLTGSVDAATRTVRARVDVNNADGRLRPGMFARIRLTDPHVPPAGPGVPVVPESALQRQGEEHVVFVPDGERRYRRREVKIGRKSGDFVEILEGLKPGERVVVKGVFLLASEAAKESMGGGHSH